jgi:hypothetical protein
VTGLFPQVPELNVRTEGTEIDPSPKAELGDLHALGCEGACFRCGPPGKPRGCPSQAPHPPLPKGHHSATPPRNQGSSRELARSESHGSIRPKSLREHRGLLTSVELSSYPSGCRRWTLCRVDRPMSHPALARSSPRVRSLCGSSRNYRQERSSEPKRQLTVFPKENTSPSAAWVPG